jgi:hypothetical protein
MVALDEKVIFIALLRAEMVPIRAPEYEYNFLDNAKGLLVPEVLKAVLYPITSLDVPPVVLVEITPLNTPGDITLEFIGED